MSNTNFNKFLKIDLANKEAEEQEKVKEGFVPLFTNINKPKKTTELKLTVVNPNERKKSRLSLSQHNDKSILENSVNNRSEIDMFKRNEMLLGSAKLKMLSKEDIDDHNAHNAHDTHNAQSTNKLISNRTINKIELIDDIRTKIISTKNIQQISDVEKRESIDIVEAKDDLLNPDKVIDFWDKRIEESIFSKETNANHSNIFNKKELELNDRLVLNYIYDKKNPGIPKFTKKDTQKEKCKEIMMFGDTSVKEKTHYFYDKGPLLEFRRVIYQIRKTISFLAYNVVKSPIFDNIILLVIILNTIFFIVSSQTDPNSLVNTTDSYFLYIYTAEFVLKVFAYGFVMPPNSYLRDGWNFLDFAVVVSGWATFLVQLIGSSSTKTGLSALRTVRALRPLKSIKSVEGLRLLLEALIGSFQGLKDIVIVLFFFYLLFAIAGVQMWQGLMRRRCVNIETGVAVSYSTYISACTDNTQCYRFNDEFNTYQCLKTLYNPPNDECTFDNTLMSFITVYLIATMEGWSDYFCYISQTFVDQFYINKVITFSYFHIILFVGGYYLLNLFLAVINSEYRTIEEQNKKAKKEVVKRLIDVIDKKKQIHDDNTEQSEIEKLKKNYIFIEKNDKILPIDYSTLKDLFLLKTNTPEEIKNLNKLILEQADIVEEKYNTEEKKIKKYHQEIIKVKESEAIGVAKTQLTINKPKVKKSTKSFNKTKAANNMYLFQEAIVKTELCYKDWAKKIIQNIDSKNFKISNLIKGQIEDKTADYQPLIEENEKNETEENNFYSDDSEVSIDKNVQEQNQFLKRLGNWLQLNKENKKKEQEKSSKRLGVLKSSKNVAKDISESEISDSFALKDDSFNLKERNEKLAEIVGKSENPTALTKTKTQMENPADPFMVVKTKIPLNEDNYISNIVTIHKPVQDTLLIERQINQKFNQKKEKMGKKHISTDSQANDPRFQFIQNNNISHLPKNKEKALEIKKLKEEYDDERSLNISVDDDVLVNDEYAQEDDLKFPDNFTPHNVNYDNLMFTQDLDNALALEREFENVDGSIVPNTTGKEFFNLNLNLNKENKKSMLVPVLNKETSKRVDYYTKILATVEPKYLHNAKVKEEAYSLNGKGKIKSGKHKKSRSIENVSFKYPTPDPAQPKENKNEEISLYLQSYQKHLLYLFNLMDKDMRVVDKFNLRKEGVDIIGTVKEEEKEKIKDSKDPIVVFNPKEVNIVKCSYVRYSEFALEEDEIALLEHNLKDLNIKALEIMPFKNYRERKKDLHKTIKTNIFKTTSNSVVKRTKLTQSINSSTLRDTSIQTSLAETLRSSFSERKALFSYYDPTINFFNGSIEYNKFNKDFLNEKAFLKKTVPKSKIKNEDIDVKNEVQNIRKYDENTNSKIYLTWSYNDVLSQKADSSLYEEWNNEINKLEELDVILWSQKPFYKQYQFFRYYFFKISFHPIFEYFVLLIVLINTTILAMDGNLIQPEIFSVLDPSNYFFNAVYIIEFLIKFLGQGPIMYFSELFHYLDVLIVTFSIIEMSTKGNNSVNLSQLAFIRVLRMFRILRLMKILRKIKSVREILSGITKALSAVAYLSLILFIFLLIFAMFAESLFYNDGKYFTVNFLQTFLNTFQLLTVENWNVILFELQSKYGMIVVLFCIIWIFIGNWVILNLFISILLDAFDQDQDEDEITYPHNYPYAFRSIEDKEREFKKKTIKKKAEEKDDDSEDEEGNILGEDSGKKIEKVIMKLLEGNECEYSCYIFAQNSPLRRKFMTIINRKWFENFILCVILLSTGRLIVDTYFDNSHPLLNVIFDILDTTFNVIFITECTLKVISLGFVMDDGSYLRDSWNKLDFTIVCISLFDFYNLISKYASGNSNNAIGFLRVLRMLRILRPLRFISHNVQLKLIINSLLDALESIANALILIIIVYFIFSIVAVTLFNGIVWTCYSAYNQPSSQFSQLAASGAINITPTYNTMGQFINGCYATSGGTLDLIPIFQYTNIFDAMYTTFSLSTQESWPDMMHSFTPFGQVYGLYFLIAIVVVQNFFMSLFTGIMFGSFNKAFNAEKNKYLKKDNKESIERYLDFLHQIDQAEPEYSTFKKKTNKISIFFTKIVTYDLFDNFIMTIIFLNLITMAVSYEGSTASFDLILRILNYIFTSIFIIEAILKLLANGISGYFYYSWNRFDFFIVCTSLLDIIITNALNPNIAFLKSFQIIRVLRVLRVTRVLRLVKALRGLEKLLQTLRWSLQALGNVLIIFLLVYFIFAILGCNLVQTVPFVKYESSFQNYNLYFNFDNFYNAFLLVFKSVTGENWDYIAIELAFADKTKQAPIVIYMYFVIMIFTTLFVILNLFIATTLQQYDDFFEKEENPIEKFNNLLVSFKKSWNFYCNEEDEGFRMKQVQLTKFFLELETEFSHKLEKNIDKIKKYIYELKLLKDTDNYVYFHDVLFKIIKKEYGINEKIRLVSKEEKKIQIYLSSKLNTIYKKIRKNKMEIKDALNTFNPITSHLYFKASFIYLAKVIEMYKGECRNMQVNSNKINIEEEEESLDN